MNRIILISMQYYFFKSLVDDNIKKKIKIQINIRVYSCDFVILFFLYSPQISFNNNPIIFLFSSHENRFIDTFQSAQKVYCTGNAHSHSRSRLPVYTKRIIKNPLYVSLHIKSVFNFAHCLGVFFKRI